MKKLSKLKLKEFAVMNDSEMKSVVGGYGEPYDAGELPPVDVYGQGPNYCKESWHFYLPSRCTEADAHNKSQCRTSDCRDIGRCGYNGRLYPTCFIAGRY